jgi:hypothetical protein
LAANFKRSNHPTFLLEGLSLQLDARRKDSGRQHTIQRRKKRFPANVCTFVDENCFKPAFRPYTKATIGNMLPATFFSNVAGVEQKNAHYDTEVEKLILFYLLTVP